MRGRWVCAPPRHVPAFAASICRTVVWAGWLGVRWRYKSPILSRLQYRIWGGVVTRQCPRLVPECVTVSQKEEAGVDGSRTHRGHAPHLRALLTSPLPGSLTLAIPSPLRASERGCCVDGYSSYWAAKAAKERERKARRLAWELLENESRGHSW